MRDYEQFTVPAQAKIQKMFDELYLHRSDIHGNMVNPLVQEGVVVEVNLSGAYCYTLTEEGVEMYMDWNRRQWEKERENDE